jgi:hypothetical protein
VLDSGVKVIMELKDVANFKISDLKMKRGLLTFNIVTYESRQQEVGQSRIKFPPAVLFMRATWT